MNILYVTSLSGKRVNAFMRSAIVAATSLGNSFTLLCNMDGAEKQLYEQDCRELGIKTIHVGMNRSPFSWSNIAAYKALRQAIRKGSYDVIHCNTPIGGLLGRIAAKKEHVPMIVYMAHGFHFWKDAPLKNWILYYPVEKLLSRITDLLITINREDYTLAKKSMRARKTVLVPGVGVNLDDFEPANGKEKSKIRLDLGMPNSATVFLTVGEINKNKNHEVVLRALAGFDESDWVYLICGDGDSRHEMQRLAQELNIDDKVCFLGFRDDIATILKAADIFVFPSLREGMPSAVMEAMASGLPVVASRIRGVVDLLPNSKLLFNPRDDKELLLRLIDSVSNKKLVKEEIEANIAHVKQFDFDSAVNALRDQYLNLMALLDDDSKAQQYRKTNIDASKSNSVPCEGIDRESIQRD